MRLLYLAAGLLHALRNTRLSALISLYVHASRTDARGQTAQLFRAGGESDGPCLHTQGW